MEISEKLPTLGISGPINDRNLSGLPGRFSLLQRPIRVLALFGVSVVLSACASGDGSSQDAARRAELREQAPRVFAEQPAPDSTDAARVFADGSGAPMTRTLSIDGSEELLPPPPRPSARPAETTPSEVLTNAGAGWSIVLERFSGAQHQARAQERAASIGRALGRSDIRVRQVSSGSAVVMGSYAAPDDDRAQRDLQYVKSLSVQGERPYSMAMLVPPPVNEVGSNPRHSLVTVGRTLDPSFTHTLHIAVFGGEEADRRSRAEQFAARLRRDGHEAYYYHGRRVSSVTVGTFTRRDFDLETGRVSAKLEAVRQQFPHTLLNGEIQRAPVTGEVQNSSLVEIPKN